MKTFDETKIEKAFRPRREELLEYLRHQVLCVFSSLDQDGAPEGATVAFSVTADGGLLIGTSQESHKSHNVRRDSRVALTVTDENDRYTVQIKGEATQLDQAVFESTYAAQHYKERPESLPFKDKPGQVHILVRPTVVRFSDCSVQPWAVTEFSEWPNESQ